MVFIYIQLVH